MKNKNKLIGIAAVAVVIVAAVAVVLALVLGGSKGKAASMWLVKTEGTVAVTDGEGADVPLRNLAGVDMRLGLFDGYSVGTEYSSYGWINLDDVKLTKLDEDSEVEIKKSGKKLELDLSRGSIFFNVTKPLEDDETLEIRSSTMVMAIRGTSGWVTAYGETMDVYIIEGEVKCTARVQGNLTPATESVKAGERARMSISGGEAKISVEKYSASDVPEFVAEEARSDEKVAGDFAGIGIDLNGGHSEPDITPPPDSGGSLGYGNAGGSGGEPDGEELAGTDPNSADYVTWKSKTLKPELQHEWAVAYINCPIFSGRAEGLDAINAFFREFAQDYVDRVTSFDASIEDDSVKYTEYYQIFGDSVNVVDNMVSVYLKYSKYNSNDTVAYSTNVGYAFDLDTGERLMLTDLVDGTDDDIRTALVRGLRKELKDLESDKLDYSKFETLDLDSMNISFEDNDNEISMHAEGFLFGGAVGVYVNTREFGDTEHGKTVKILLPLNWPVNLAVKYFPNPTSETVTGYSLTDAGYIVENNLFADVSYPRITGTAPGLERMNAAIEQIALDFVNGPDYTGVVERARDDPQASRRYYVTMSENNGYNDEFVSISYSVEQREGSTAGQPTNKMSFGGYTFDTKTGEQIKLTDFVGGGDRAILKYIADYLISDNYVGEEYRDRIMALDPDDMMFYVTCLPDNGYCEVIVVFELDDIGHESYVPQYDDRECDVVRIEMPGNLFY